MEDEYEMFDDAEDRDIERYIERRRKEYANEWRQYLSEDMTRDELKFYLFSTIQ